MLPRYETPGVSSWNERRRLIRFRRQREHLRFSEEIKLVPRGLVWAMFALLVIAELAAHVMLRSDFPERWPLVLDYGFKAALNLTAAIVFGVWTVVAALAFLTGYVYRDARRRGMNAALWVFLVLVMLPAYLAVGFVLYFTAREPLPYHCPKCGSLVSARYNFCPGCKYELHRTCGNCRREVGDVDRYCPHCGNDTAPALQTV
jgi:RNA polymerase subunit RPABC4/transcription elongation factor Spt4